MKRKCVKIHLTLEARLFIEEELNQGASISTIARSLDRDSSNLRKEIDKNKTIMLPSAYGGTSYCIHKKNCLKRTYGCESKCEQFELEICDYLKASPHVCNNCAHKQGCRKAKFYYRGKEANAQYKENLINSRNKLHYTQIELDIINNDFYWLVIHTKSIYHSLQVINSMGFNFNIKSIYRQIKDNRLRLKPSDLPRANLKNLNKAKKDNSYKRDNIEGHTYEDYKKVIEENPNIIEWQLDCVQGIQGKNEQVFLTLQIVKIKFLFIFPLKVQTQKEVIKALKQFRGILSEDKVNTLIELLLTDNGHEFINLNELIEILATNNIFYCHPYSSYEKGSIENNHELIRRIIPQGVSLNIYNETDIKLLCSHINSLFREELNGKCPFDLINNYLSEKTINKLGYSKINPKDVKLIPELLGRKNILNIKKYLTKQEIKKAHIKFIEEEKHKKNEHKK